MTLEEETPGYPEAGVTIFPLSTANLRGTQQGSYGRRLSEVHPRPPQASITNIPSAEMVTMSSFLWGLQKFDVKVQKLFFDMT